MASKTNLRLLILEDDRPGHRRQLQGLMEAISRQRPVAVRPRKPLTWREQVRCWLGQGSSEQPERPHMILGAGHLTHASLLALRRALGAPAVVLMKPSLPLACFDLCLIPDHDRVEGSDRVIQTRGVLSPVRPGKADASARNTVALIGGPIKHGRWDPVKIWSALASWAQTHSQPVQVVTSRRTPASFKQKMPENLQNRVIWSPANQTEGWLDRALPEAARIAVTADSLSMQADASASGRPVTLITEGIELPARHQRAIVLFRSRGRIHKDEKTGADLAATSLLRWWDERHS